MKTYLIKAVLASYAIIRAVGNPKLCAAVVACVLSSSTASEFGRWQGRIEEKVKQPAVVATHKTPVLTARQADHLAGFGIRWSDKIEEIKRVKSEADRQAILATRPN